MSAGRRLAAYGLVLVGLFATAYAVGERLPGHDHGAAATDHDSHDEMSAMGTDASSADQLALASSASGYRLVIDDHTDTSLRFHLDHEGRPVTAFTTVHDADLHLVLVRRDLSGFQHVHPALAADGTWTVDDVDLSTPGAWRVVVDTRPADADVSIALGADVLVAGDAPVVPLPAARPLAGDDTATVDGLTVTRHGLHLTVTPADGLEPYLGQPAHLVALRAGDLAYVHLHPTTDTLGDSIFADTLPGPGTYRLFLQVQRDGVVVTVPFTVEVT